ncbi:MAG: carboxypeptidase regulatory-like domain-containing protein, partial [Prevotella sp.]|nr:carboxypeptidase regulatory-like domain-containing protein [Prevotella sp.]
GTSDIRVYTEAIEQGSGNWMSATYAYDSEIQMSYNSTMKAAPVAYFTLAAEPATIAGTVKDAAGAAIEGATVTLVSTDGDNIQYTGTTDAEGAYSINVIQATRKYNVTVTKDNQEDFEDNVTIDGTAHNYMLLDVVTLAEDQTEAITDKASAIVKIDRAFKAGWNAVVLPIDITADELAAIDADYELVSYVGDEGTDAVTVKFAPVTDGIKAGVPYMLFLNNAVSGLKYKKSVSTTITNATGTIFDFVGVYTQTTTADGDYIVQGGEFRKAGTTNWVLPFRAYLKLKAGATARSINFEVVDGNTTTAIDAAEISGLEVEGAYNLNGQKVNSLNRKGLYIINGKKVLVK